MLHMHRGTPYIYQGEELGMTNAHFTRLDQYRDLETLNAYRQRVEEAQVQTAESIMDAFAKRSRDNARTPMQWDDSAYAGFMDADAAVGPWISVNPNHDAINAAAEVNDPDSVYAFYRRLIALRHEDPVVAAGDWELVDADSEQVYAFTRTLGGERLLVMVNMTADETAVPAESAALPAGRSHGRCGGDRHLRRARRRRLRRRPRGRLPHGRHVGPVGGHRRPYLTGSTPPSASSSSVIACRGTYPHPRGYVPLGVYAGRKFHG